MSSKGLVFIDGCTIGHIKDDVYRDRLTTELKQFYKKGYKFSFLLILLERGVSFSSNPEKMEELIEEFEKDYDVLEDLLGTNKAIQEPRYGFKPMLEALMDHDYELEDTAEGLLRKRLELILIYNRLGNKHQLSGDAYLNTAKIIKNEGVLLGLLSNDPVIVTCIAALYQCDGANRILKLKADKDEQSNANNSLMDIMVLQRIETIKHLMLRNKKSLEGFDLVFRTEDKGLQDFFNNIQLKTEEGEDQDGTRGVIGYDYTINDYRKLFPYLFSKKQNRSRELKTICELIGLTYPDNSSQERKD